MTKNKVVIEVDGGVVQTVYLSHDLIKQNVEVTLIDHDNIKARDGGGEMDAGEKVAAEMIEHNKVKEVPFE